MTFKSPAWFPIAVVLSVVNVIAIWFAAAPFAPWHATIHGVLAVGFGSWAHRLKQRRGRSENQVGLEAAEALDALEAAEAELGRMRRELTEAQERLDFAERQLAQHDVRRIDQERNQP